MSALHLMRVLFPSRIQAEPLCVLLSLRLLMESCTVILVLDCAAVPPLTEQRKYADQSRAFSH